MIKREARAGSGCLIFKNELVETALQKMNIISSLTLVTVIPSALIPFMVSLKIYRPFWDRDSSKYNQL